LQKVRFDFRVQFLHYKNAKLPNPFACVLKGETYEVELRGMATANRRGHEVQQLTFWHIDNGSKQEPSLHFPGIRVEFLERLYSLTLI